jgi:hypothetical protein
MSLGNVFIILTFERVVINGVGRERSWKVFKDEVVFET